MSLYTRFKDYWQNKHQAEKSPRQLPGMMRVWAVPTAFGCMMFAVLIIMFIWSANYQLNLGYALTFLLFVLWLFGWIVVAQEPAGLSVSVAPGKPVWAGDSAAFHITLRENDGKARGSITLRNDSESTVLGLNAGETTTAVLHEPTRQRGRHKMAMFELYSTYPAGAFVAWQWLWLQAEVLVYPRPEGDLPLPWQPVAGQGKSVATAAGEEEFTGLRAYRPGDPLSRVAWKHYGRGNLLLKQFSGVGTARVLLDYAAVPGNTEQRLSQLAKWIVQAQQQQLEYALQLPDAYFDFACTPGHTAACLRALALFGDRK